MLFSGRSVFTHISLAIAAMIVVLFPANAGAQSCFQHVSNINYSPTNCSAQPEYDRVFRLQTVTWKNHKYLFVDEGNEIRIMNIDNPLNPTTLATSFFNIPNVGDSDYDLQNFTVCDDSRYGMANNKAATVLFDLGTGTTPSFGSVHKNFDARIVLGGFTFKVDAQQYLIAASLGSNNCSGGNDSALYQFNGIDEANNPVLECVTAGGSGVQIVNGLFIDSVSPPVLYMSERFDQFRIFETHASPVFGLDYAGNGGIPRANMYRGYGLAVDEAAGLAAVADFGELSIYDIGYSTGSPASPTLISTEVLPTQDQANAVALRYPVVHVAQQYTTDEPLTFYVSNPTDPVPLDQAFWDPSNAWNSLGLCMWNNHAVFSDDGAAMYLSRYSVLQVIDPTACYGPVAPLANLTLSPQPAFPGDLLTVTNTSVGGQRFATWITDGADPHNSDVLAPPGGVVPSFGATNGPLTYVLPADMASGVVFYAHAAAETDDFPYVPGSTPDQIKTQQISIDRTPEAVIIITPPTALTGDSVDLTAVAEGNPGDVGGGDPFGWTVTDPSGSPTGYTGPQVNGVVLDTSGDWIFDLRVDYEHDAPGQPGVPYQDTAQQIKSISSVAASFEITPSNPLHNQVITLTSNSAAQSGATLDFDWDVLTPGTQTIVNELSGCDGPGLTDDECVIPAETLTWGIYDFRLTLVNTNNGDQDVVLIEDFEVFNGNIQIDFSWAPTSPEIGQWIGFQITGIPSHDVEQAVWAFGGIGCDGTTTYTCTAPSFPSCDQAAFAFASGGTKTVRLTVTTTGGVVQPEVSHTITVASTGSCDGTCTYSISPTLRTFPDTGGTGTIWVSTQSGCTWTASEASAWVSISSGASGTGPGTVTYQVSANTGAARSANIVVAGKIHTINQSSSSSCGQGSVPDDGSVENGYGWGTGSVFVQRFTPDSYPFVYTDVCAAFTQAGGDTTLDFDLLLFDDDGPGGGPGTLLAAVPASLDGVPAWLDHIFASVSVQSALVTVDGGSVFIGVGWDQGTEIGFFVAADESVGTPLQDGRFSSDGVSWIEISDAFPDYRSLVIRAVGFSTVDGEWEQRVGSIFGGGNGFGDPFNTNVETMASFDGALFVGTGNQFGGEVNFTTDGESWLLGNQPGFDDPTNNAIDTLIDFEGHLYASTLNPVSGTQVWRTAAPPVWTFVDGGGFGDPLNSSAPSGAVFDAGLYLGTGNPNGCEIWRAPDGVTWTQVHTNGFGNPQNEVAESMATFRGELHVGTRNIGGAELWKSPDGFVWFSVATGGFGSAANAAITDLVVFNGVFYAGVSNSMTGAQIWRSASGSNWQQMVGDGFGDPGNSEFETFGIGDLGLVAAVSGPTNPGTVWQSPDGLTWGAISSPGFADPDNEVIGALHYWGDRVYAGTSNPTFGCEVWRSGRHPLFEDGFETGDTSGWTWVAP